LKVFYTVVYLRHSILHKIQKDLTHVACFLSYPLLTSPNTPTRVVKGASPSAHQQREGALFKALFDDTHPQGEKIIYAIPTLISKLSPEVITIKDKNGFFSNVNFSAKGITSCEFQNVIAFDIKNAFQRGLLFAVGDDLPNFRAIDEMTKIKEIVSDAKLKEKLDSLNFEITNELTNQLPNYTIKDKEDVFQLIQDVVLSLKEPWNEKNRETVKNQINDYFPFLKNRY